MPNILLHTCCGPCSIECITHLRKNCYSPTAFWYNPNIHPYTEYTHRLNSLKEASHQLNFPLAIEDHYNIREFATNTYNINRCEYCYQTRLFRTAAHAAEHNYGAFSTSLLISPYQKHELIRSIAQQAAEQHNIEFVYIDFRPNFREGQRRAREMGLYMQKYCGCIFSEEERYQPSK